MNCHFVNKYIIGGRGPPIFQDPPGPRCIAPVAPAVATALTIPCMKLTHRPLRRGRHHYPSSNLFYGVWYNINIFSVRWKLPTIIINNYLYVYAKTSASLFGLKHCCCLIQSEKLAIKICDFLQAGIPTCMEIMRIYCIVHKRLHKIWIKTDYRAKIKFNNSKAISRTRYLSMLKTVLEYFFFCTRIALTIL